MAAKALVPKGIPVSFPRSGTCGKIDNTTYLPWVKMGYPSLPGFYQGASFNS